MVLGWIAAHGLAFAAPLAMSVQEEQGRLELRLRDRPLLGYAFATNQFKPYVRELYTLRGENVLRDAPADHLHHHGLMYAITVNGINFWEEQVVPGIIKPIRLLDRSTRTVNGRPQARFTHRLHWVAPAHRKSPDTAAVALLVETRTLTLRVDEAAGEVALEWDAAFEVPAAQTSVELQGAEYHGLGLRFPESLDRVAEFQNSLGTAFTMPQGRAVLAARWTSVSGCVSEKPVTIAVFGHPDNAGGDPRFFSMREPFTYLSATQGLKEWPIRLRGGDRFRLRYLITVVGELQTADQLNRRDAAWRGAR